jgi:Transcription factor WhiB
MTMGAPAPEPAELSDHELQARITSRDAQCVVSPGDPDDWFPISADPGKASAQSARALALCTACAVRAACLEVALRHWRDAGRHGIWGGTLETQREELRDKWLAGHSVTELLTLDGPGRWSQSRVA